MSACGCAKKSLAWADQINKENGHTAVDVNQSAKNADESSWANAQTSNLSAQSNAHRHANQHEHKASPSVHKRTCTTTRACVSDPSQDCDKPDECEHRLKRLDRSRKLLPLPQCLPSCRTKQTGTAFAPWRARHLQRPAAHRMRPHLPRCAPMRSKVAPPLRQGAQI